MKKRLLYLCAVLALSGLGYAQNGFELYWSAVGGVGECMTAGPYLVTADNVSLSGPGMTGGAFDVQPGFYQDGSYFPVPVAVSRFTLE